MKPNGNYSTEERQLLLDLALDSIQHGVNHGSALPVALEDWAEPLQGEAAYFVTLKMDDSLRGCIGSVEAHRPLVEEISENAFAAAFRDPRFSPVTSAEYEHLHTSISVLTQPELLTFESTLSLSEMLRPGTDGVILQAEHRRSVFLPQVWESLPDPAEFLKHLKRKGGIPDDLQPPYLEAWRFRAISF